MTVLKDKTLPFCGKCLSAKDALIHDMTCSFDHVFVPVVRLSDALDYAVQQCMKEQEWGRREALKEVGERDAILAKKLAAIRKLISDAAKNSKVGNDEGAWLLIDTAVEQIAKIETELQSSFPEPERRKQLEKQVEGKK